MSNIIEMARKGAARQLGCSPAEISYHVGTEVGVVFFRDGRPWENIRISDFCTPRAETVFIEKSGSPKCRFVPAKCRIGRL